jgi:hypothetical protein
MRRLPRDLAGRDCGEKIADAIGRAWGFWSEEEQFDRDVAKLT